MVLHPVGIWSLVLSPRNKRLAHSCLIINVLDEGIEATISKFTDGTNLGQNVSLLGGRNALFQPLNRLDKWAEINSIKVQ